MSRLSAREKLFAGIFLVALAWGIWNYRHLFSSGTPSPVGQDSISAAVGPDAPVVNTATMATAETDFEAPDWGVDPFYPAWRRPAARQP